MKRLFSAIAALALSFSAAMAGDGQFAAPAVTTIAPQNGLLPTNGVQTCGSQSTPITTFTAAGQTASLSCPGAGTYDVRIVPNASSPLVGTFTSTDLAQPAAPSGRRLYKNGVGPLENSTESLTSTNTTPITYRANGGDNLTISLTSYTSGSAAIYISASYAASMVLVNGSVDTREEAALRQGKAFTHTTGIRNLATGAMAALYLSNPANSGVRLVIPTSSRIFTCDNVSSAQLPKWASLPNPTSNVPVSTSSTANTAITRRGGTSGTSAATAISDVLASGSTPATSPATSYPVGGAFFSSYVITQDRTLEPGNSVILYITGVAVPSGLGTTTSNCSIIISWFEESLN